MPAGKDTSRATLGVKRFKHGCCKLTRTNKSEYGGFVLQPKRFACRSRCFCLHTRVDACCHQKDCSNGAMPVLSEYAAACNVAASDNETHFTSKFTFRFRTLPMILSRFCAT